ncbi:LytTR family transcriptional regulator DNA-binding domain-containing protein [Caldalkalibacillus mannanilyticus]|uniref:LytTR family transcriptional regulator DNA-binding domain-containing protein n=1 Tax=Caldalkalibacillus mannanilyticus TaxID=1418 RepID=UPI0004697587|nr:LytTR family transcriptional regulator DNA-binding domain-containing protein [Caldalkalibacillus mannanilyticus]
MDVMIPVIKKTKDGEEVVLIPFKDFSSVFTDPHNKNNQICIYNRETYLVPSTMNHWSIILEQFTGLKVDRGVVVNKDKIIDYDEKRDHVILEDHSEYFVALPYRKTIKSIKQQKKRPK